MDLFLKINLTMTVVFAFMYASDYVIREMAERAVPEWFKYIGGMVVCYLLLAWPIHAGIKIWI